jgi:hypothetical protein
MNLRCETVEMGVPRASRVSWACAVCRATAGARTRGVRAQYVAGCEPRGRQASGSSSLQLGEKDGQFRGHSHAKA